MVAIGLSLALGGCGLLGATEDPPQVETRQDVRHDAARTTAAEQAAPDGPAAGSGADPATGSAAQSTAESSGSQASPDEADSPARDADPSPWAGMSAPETSFVMPSTNVACAIADDWVACEIRNRDYVPLTSDVAPDCAPNQADSILLRAAEPSRWICSDRSLFTLADTVGSELAYGERSRVGDFECLSDPDGVACASPSGGYFRLARGDYEVW